jgi:hypothetical protein
MLQRLQGLPGGSRTIRHHRFRHPPQPVAKGRAQLHRLLERNPGSLLGQIRRVLAGEQVNQGGTQAVEVGSGHGSAAKLLQGHVAVAPTTV